MCRTRRFSWSSTRSGSAWHSCISCAAAWGAAVMRPTASSLRGGRQQGRSGFRLAEEDLRLRGPGQFFGAMQHGLGDLKIADVLADMDLLLLARRAALATIDDPAALDFVRPALLQQYREQFEHIREV